MSAWQGTMAAYTRRVAVLARVLALLLTVQQKTPTFCACKVCSLQI